jgi:SAM-dependent methyltransferase
MSLWDAAVERDGGRYLQDDFLKRWLFADRLAARDDGDWMSFYAYEGPGHVWKYMVWIRDFDYPDWFRKQPRYQELIRTSVERDRAALAALGLDEGDLKLRRIGVYNMQDYVLQRFYPVPEAQALRTVLDFGAGHGRMANLAFSNLDETTETIIAVDGIPGSYLTQRAYYTGLGLRLADYLDITDAGAELDVAQAAVDHDVVHLPTWRLDLVPDASVDMVTCVQVLKELPRRLVPHVLAQFARVVKPGGALYVRDHLQDHNPNQMPMDELFAAHGFVLEFAPHVADRRDIHGVPRIWRRLDVERYFGRQD